jgi:hypothetical protein
VDTAKYSARLANTPTTAAVMPVKAPARVLLLRSRSMQGAPRKMNRKVGTNVTQVASNDADVAPLLALSSSSSVGLSRGVDVKLVGDTRKRRGNRAPASRRSSGWAGVSGRVPRPPGGCPGCHPKDQRRPVWHRLLLARFLGKLMIMEGHPA